MSIGELDSLASEAVDVGGFDFGSSVAAEVAVAEIVGENEDDVRLSGRLFLSREAKAEREKQAGAGNEWKSFHLFPKGQSRMSLEVKP